MIAPFISKNEDSRLEELKSFNILDTLPEEDYDNITSIASGICNTQISLVTLVDETRQWFKSTAGIEISETPKEFSFCAHAINNPEEMMIVEDTRKDDRFVDNPFVVGEPFVNFYAGVPLVTTTGLSIGTLCVLDGEPKGLTSGQIKSLKVLAKQVVILLELRKKKSLLELALINLEEKNKRLEQFTFIASHDLQEPLRTVKSLTTFIDEKYRDKLDERGQKSVQFIIESSDRMSNLIKGLLHYSHLGNQNDKDLVDLDLLVKTIFLDIDLLVKETGASIKIGPLPTLKVYETELRLLFQNLIINAIKFAKKGMVPQIEIFAEEMENNWKFAVSDNGIGIADKHKEKIFEIFQRLHLKSEYKGTGIGLAHCQRIVEIHQGKIWVDSQEGEGSTFFFSLPKK